MFYYDSAICSTAVYTEVNSSSIVLILESAHRLNFGSLPISGAFKVI